mmetsp:Transcript_97457/g.210186  ORF Transcript_97457/g.210186 Transcript_97457/m.210186 type:complete len:250 (+) Transcript_97457:1453-2202(+)
MFLLATRPRPEISFSPCSRVSMAIATGEDCRPQSEASETQTPASSSHWRKRVFCSSFFRFALPRPESHRFSPPSDLPPAAGAAGPSDVLDRDRRLVAAARLSSTPASSPPSFDRLRLRFGLMAAPSPTGLGGGEGFLGAGKLSMGSGAWGGSTLNSSRETSSSPMGTRMTPSRSSASAPRLTRPLGRLGDGAARPKPGTHALMSPEKERQSHSAPAAAPAWSSSLWPRRPEGALWTALAEPAQRLPSPG